MPPSNPPSIFLTTLLFLFLQQCHSHPPLILPALLPTPQNTTTLSCINLTTPFTPSSAPGIVDTLSLTLATTNTTYTILPPRYNGGLHNAPVPQLVHFLSGLIHVTLPQDLLGEGLWIVGGKGGLLFAADTVGWGHVTTYPGDGETVAIAVPFEGGKVPRYSVVREGGCGGLQTFL